MSTNEILRNLKDGALSDRVASALMADKVGQGVYTLEVFEKHITAINERGESYLGFIEKMKSNPATMSMFSFVVQGGPDAVYSLLGMMAEQGLVDKKLVSSSAGISTGASGEKPWFRSVLDEIAVVGYAAMDAHLKSNIEGYRKRFPSIPSTVTNLKDLLTECQKSTLFSAIDGAEINVKQKDGKDKSITTALGFRIDAHSSARNGGWDPEAKAFVEPKAKDAPEATAAPAAPAGK